MLRILVSAALCLPCVGQELFVQLTSPRIPADAIFSDADGGIDLGPSPAPGVRRRVSRGQLLRWARQAAIPESNVPEAIVLERRLKTWSESEAAELVRQLAAEEAGVEALAVEAEVIGYAGMRTPAGALTWSLLGASESLERPMRLSLRWSEEGGRSGVESLMAKLRVSTLALVTTAVLRAGAEVHAADFTLTRTDVATLRERYLTELEPDVQWTLTKGLKAGEALREEIIERRPDVERGAMVELLLARGAVRLRAPARAEGAGSIGDLIPFRNLATDQRVLARVTGSKTAEAAAQ